MWLDDNSSTGLREIEALLLEEAHKVSCLTGPRRKVLTPQDPGPDLLAGLGGFLGGGEGGRGQCGKAVVHYGDKDIGAGGTRE